MSAEHDRPLTALALRLAHTVNAWRGGYEFHIDRGTLDRLMLENNRPPIVFYDPGLRIANIPAVIAPDDEPGLSIHRDRTGRHAA